MTIKSSKFEFGGHSSDYAKLIQSVISFELLVLSASKFSMQYYNIAFRISDHVKGEAITLRQPVVPNMVWYRQRTHNSLGHH